MSLLHHDARSEALAQLSCFRGEFYSCLTARSDALFELADAVLCGDGPVRSLAELSLVGEHRRGHGGLYATLARGRIDDLSVRNMVKNRKLARAISDAAWSEFRSMLEYKAQWYGREVIAVVRWFPSSKLCSACGTLQDKMPLNVRTWTCDCGATHDRDVNAAKNLLAAGRAVAACGAGVRPQRSSPGGQSAMKQEVSRREP